MTRFQVIVAALLVAGCYGQETRIGSTDGGIDPDSPADGGDVSWDTAPDLTDVAADTALDDGSCYQSPPCPGVADNGLMGEACLTHEDCDEMLGSFCMTQSIQEYDGEAYISNPRGACVFFADEDHGCDLRNDEGCPAGSHCIYTGEWRGVTYYGCFDACTPGDTSGEMHDWACGCRKGYQCDPSSYVCFSGCSNDRQCCEIWEDENENFNRDDGEVTLVEGCTSYCDGDDSSEWADCMASWSCINPGTPGAMIGDPCRHDSECPEDGECLYYVDRETGEDYFPGGYCSKVGCQFTGRGCEEAGGRCLNIGTIDRPAGRCLKACHVGLEIDDPEYGCRTTEGQQQACRPIPSIGWIGGAPPDGEDGFCFPGSFGSGTTALGENCAGSEDCASPYGLGECNDWFGPLFCTVSCNEDLAVEESICGAEGGDGLASGICGWGMCWPGCSGIHMLLGENGCSRPDFACAPLTLLESTIWVADGLLKPPGFCMPGCLSDSFCEDVFGDGYSCNSYTGVCG